MVTKYSKSLFDYLVCGILLVVVRIIYGPPSFLLQLFNVITFCVFAYDKLYASSKNRVAENLLFLLSLCGGWIGGLLAMLIFRHKTSKSNFLITMAVIALVNILFVSKVVNGGFRR